LEEELRQQKTGSLVKDLAWILLQSIPCTVPRPSSGRIVGWDEAVQPARETSHFGTIYGRIPGSI